MIEVENLSKRYGEKLAAGGLDFVVQPGIVTGFPGPNGAGASAVWADALFVSALQRSDNPSMGQVRKAIAGAVHAHGGRGCAERVAQEFGDHPETAVARMRWARAAAGEVLASPAGPAQDSVRRRPGLPVAGPRRPRLVRT
jgi:ABC-type branched-subunit amino acid transport system ATPase component